MTERVLSTSCCGSALSRDLAESHGSGRLVANPSPTPKSELGKGGRSLGLNEQIRVLSLVDDRSGSARSSHYPCNSAASSQAGHRNDHSCDLLGPFRNLAVQAWIREVLRVAGLFLSDLVGDVYVCAGDCFLCLARISAPRLAASTRSLTEPNSRRSRADRAKVRRNSCLN